MTSILTNTSAMTALKVIRQTEQALGTTQERISTGLKVNSAKDDASTWAISQGIKSDISAFKTMAEGLTMASNAIKVAAEAATQINDKITEIKQKIAQAKQPGADRQAIQDNIDSALRTIANITSNASFNGTNLVDNVNVLKVLASTSRDANGAATANYIDVQGRNLNITNGGGLSMLNGLKVTRDALVTGSSMPQSVLNLGDATSAGVLTLNYRTTDGQAKAVSLNVANLATEESIAQNLVDTFGDQLKADGLEVTTDGAGNLTLTATKSGARLVSASSTATGVAPAQVNQVALNFTDATMSVGDEFRFSVNINGTVQTAVLRVGTSPTAVLGDDADGNTIVGLDIADMDDATEIAAELEQALRMVTWDHDANTGTAEVNLFATGATTGTDFNIASAAGVLTITSQAGADFINDVTLPDADFADLLDRVEAAATIARGAAQAFGTAQSQADSQRDFLKNLIDSLETGVGALIDADITAESARLNALQTQQQLSTQSLSIANQSTQSILTLFRS